MGKNIILRGNRESFPGDHLRYDYNLNENSIVFDLGAFNGEFTNIIYEKYKCFVYSFEPVSRYYDMCLEKFKNIDKIKTYKQGLSSENKLINFNVAGEASSIYFGTVVGEYDVKLKKIDEFLIEMGVNNIDLIKINIEGSEYELLEYLINNNLIKIFKNLQIQFHENPFDGWEEKYKYIKTNLSLTHHLTYEFEFKFENWEIN